MTTLNAELARLPQAEGWKDRSDKLQHLLR